MDLKVIDYKLGGLSGSDILIESPSAMSGIHIAEALGYLILERSPCPGQEPEPIHMHSFVPEQKKGGSYNYLTHVLFENIFWKVFPDK